MKTGEGKTLVATLPSYLNALTGKGVHIITVNDYLAEYQSELMGRIHRALGMETGCILSSMTPEQRRAEYAKDITYGTNNEFGFDYLRDNMAWEPAELVQRGHHYAIVDEVDSILIDEAHALIISGPADIATKWYVEFARIASRLGRGEDGRGDYEVDEKKRTVGVLESGIARVEDLLGIENLYDTVNTPLIGYLNNSIKAKELFKRDKDYVVMNGEILIVDEHTGRMLRAPLQRGHAPGDRGEGGRRDQEREPDARDDHPPELLPHVREALGHDRHRPDRGGRAQLDLQARCHPDPHEHADDPEGPGRPRLPHRGREVQRGRRRHRRAAHARAAVLVGTTSVEKSEYLSQQLKKQGIKHEVLNAKQHEREAAIVAEAGRSAP